jgi:glutamyl-tRNA synthetase
VYECYCTRAEIRAAASAPNGPQPDGAYPGTCRDLGDDERGARRASGRAPALRLRTDGETVGLVDRRLGTITGRVDDVVLRRGDGVPAYNLAVVVDDALQGVTQVVRADDLVPSTPRQVHLQRLLGLPTPEYLHVPLVLGDDGVRLAKRHGAVTMRELASGGIGPADVLSMLALSLGLARTGERVTADVLVERFDPAALPAGPVRLADLQRSGS